VSKWLTFGEPRPSPSGKTQTWDVMSRASGALLGSVYWWPRWRQYVFEPSGAARVIFEEDCLRDSAAFCEARTAEHKARGGQQP
jgi:hypothetical protein